MLKLGLLGRGAGVDAGAELPQAPAVVLLLPHAPLADGTLPFTCLKRGRV